MPNRENHSNSYTTEEREERERERGTAVREEV
jgi:hypothetical protein